MIREIIIVLATTEAVPVTPIHTITQTIMEVIITPTLMDPPITTVAKAPAHTPLPVAKPTKSNNFESFLTFNNTRKYFFLYLLAINMQTYHKKKKKKKKKKKELELL
eukprot:Phypoly_transcript_21900.p1 GENE.Phypoly_transcript_21900~~Phypoly_transcript_21900.p1  ORF type:complete len:107 (+),score=11.56 Phypoly_transcript_21900:169-489(+)